MGARLLQASFTGGEISPALYARVDLARYTTSLRTCRNFIVRPTGGVTNRAGSQFCAEVKTSSARVRLIPFVVSTSVAYVVEVGNLYMRFYVDGALLTTAGPTIVEIASPYTTADLAGLRFTQSADVMTITHPSHAPRELRRTSATTFELTEFLARNGPFQDVNAFSSYTMHSSAATGTVTITASIATFTSNSVGQLVFIEARDLRSIPPWEPAKMLAKGGGSPTNPLGLLRRSDGKVYRCVTSEVATGTQEIRTGTVRPTHDFGIEQDGDGNATASTVQRAGVKWEYLNSGYGIARITAYTNSTTVTAQVLSRFPDSVVGGQGSTLNTFNLTGNGSATSFSITGATQTDPFQYIVTVGGTRINAGEQTGGARGYLINPDSDTIYITPAVGNGVAIVVTEINPTGDGRSERWALGAWSVTSGYPSVVEYAGDRLTFAASTAQPQTTWMSKIANYTDFGKSVPLADDDAITFTINARQLNAIRAILPLRKMLLLTSSLEALVTQNANGVITPSTVGYDPQTYRGCSSVAPVVIGNSAVYVQDRGFTVRDIGYDFQTDGYTGNDLTVFASHLFENHTITDIAFQQVPFSCVWMIRDDGTMLGLTYVREQEVIGWHRHDTLGTYEQVAVIPEGGEDAVYVVVNRTIDGETVRYVERFASRLFEEQVDAFIVDSGLSYDGRNDDVGLMVTGGTNWTTAETLTVTAAGQFAITDINDYIVLDNGTDKVRLRVSAYVGVNEVSVRPLATVPEAFRAVSIFGWAFARDTISGLDHLEGETVSVLSDGNVHPQRVVTDGEITLQTPGAVVHVGLPYVSDWETLEMTQIGAETIRERAKTVSKVTLIVDKSRGMLAGPDSSNLTEVKQREFEPYLDPTSPLTDIAQTYIAHGWSTSGRVFVRQSDPLPLTILGAIPEVTIVK